MNTSNRQETQGSLDELRKMLVEFDTAMLTTATPAGLLRARPMQIQDPAALPHCDLWFVTGMPSPKTLEIALQEQVGVACHRSRDRAYLSISASARTVRDPARVRELFKPAWKAWFPDGPDDPSIAVLELTVEHAEYWEPSGGRARVLYEMVKSIVRGERADANLPPPKRI